MVVGLSCCFQFFSNNLLAMLPRPLPCAIGRRSDMSAFRRVICMSTWHHHGAPDAPYRSTSCLTKTYRVIVRQSSICRHLSLPDFGHLKCLELAKILSGGGTNTLFRSSSFSSKLRGFPLSRPTRFSPTLMSRSIITE